MAGFTAARGGAAPLRQRPAGKPVSLGCIDQRLRDAAHFWHFAPVGTKVVVTH